MSDSEGGQSLLRPSPRGLMPTSRLCRWKPLGHPRAECVKSFPDRMAGAVGIMPVCHDYSTSGAVPVKPSRTTIRHRLIDLWASPGRGPLCRHLWPEFLARSCPGHRHRDNQTHGFCKAFGRWRVFVGCAGVRRVVGPKIRRGTVSDGAQEQCAGGPPGTAGRKRRRSVVVLARWQRGFPAWTRPFNRERKVASG